MTSPASIVWFRNDLRLADNPALNAAILRGGPVIPIFIWAPEEEGQWVPGGASRWWLHHSLRQLSAKLEGLGSSLILCRGGSRECLLKVARQTKAKAVFWSARYEPEVICRDRAVQQSLEAQGLTVEISDAGLLTDPWIIRNSSGKAFQVFTAFWRKCLDTIEPPEPVPAPRKLCKFEGELSSLSLSDLGLEPRINWASGLVAAWDPGEAGAQRALRAFAAKPLGQYKLERDRPDLQGTSRFSPHLHFGELTARQIWHALKRANKKRGGTASWKTSQFVAELGWREFAHHLLCHFPNVPTQPLRPAFAKFPWRSDAALLKAWQKGRTGYPMVDAGMRELWATGWMHNRVRMIVASFLVKHLLIPWQEGTRWFWDTLVDADLANNTLGWQWTAGCGADAAPFFRVFNPVNQGEKFDPDGRYIKHWIPELRKLKSRWIHKPWQAPVEEQRQAEVELGRSYPRPIVDHAVARSRALAAFEKFKSGNSDKARAKPEAEV